jgi:hypothetical protein
MSRAGDFYRGIEDHIASTGRSIIGVFDGPVSFTYSIGNHVAGKPEIIICGVSPRDAAPIINQVSETVDFRLVEDGQPLDIGGRIPLRAVWCGEAAKADYTIQAGRYFGHDRYRVLQLLIPDPQGRYPGDPDCAEPYASAPVLRDPLN